MDRDSGELLHRSWDGDGDAFEALLVRHLPRLRAFLRSRMSELLRRHDSAEDLVQSACREVLAHKDHFEYRGEEAFRAWLYTAVLQKLWAKERNLRREKRDAKRQVAIDDAALAQAYSEALSPSERAIAAERVRRLEEAFDKLPPQYREVIAWSRIAGLSREQVAAQMQRSVDSVRNLLHRALAALAELLIEPEDREA